MQGSAKQKGVQFYAISKNKKAPPNAVAVEGGILERDVVRREGKEQFKTIDDVADSFKDIITVCKK